MGAQTECKEKTVPMYAKVGWALAWAVMAILVLMILRNCVTSVKYGSRTATGTVEEFYQQGLRDGAAGKEFFLPDGSKENPVLRKSYNKGYREGMDKRKLAPQ